VRVGVVVAVTVPAGGGGGVDVGEDGVDVPVTVPAGVGGGVDEDDGGGGGDDDDDDDGLAAPGEDVADAELELFGPHPTTPAARQKATRSQAGTAGRP